VLDFLMNQALTARYKFWLLHDLSHNYVEQERESNLRKSL
jgi:hypothetical protein